MRDREAEFESMGAEAMPANFSYIDRVMRTGVEDVLIRQQSRREFEPLGLISVLARWLGKTSDQ